MKVQVEELSPVEKKLSIEVDSTRVSDELTRAYTALGRQVKLPGFRQGKVPRRILEQRFRQQVEDDVIQRVVQSAYVEAVREHKVEVVSQPQVTNSGLKAGAPFSFEARVEVKPKLELKDYKELPLKKTEVSVDDAQVSEQVEKMRQSLTRLEPVTDRDVAQSGDVVTVDYEALIDGQPFAGNKAEDVAVNVAPGELVESNLAALEGAKVGDTKELDYAFPPDYRVEEVKGKTAHFKMHVKGLKTKVVPELNDEFAKETGVGVETLEALRAKVKADLERSQRTKIDAEDRDTVIKGLIERNPFEVPKAMVERAIDSMLEGAMRQMARSGLDVRNLNLDFLRLREEMRERAIQEVKGTLLFEAIAEKEGIQATEGDVEKKIEDLAAEAGQPVSAVRKYFKSAEERMGLSLRLREEKTIEFLKAQAKYS
ncbi:trigger factor [Stigmatella aurantiaca]|uniref:Trigger factor n=1 Tax=Stigmatella aurantiaca (strain DW4/3-1) TaxID=378806 RepID=E3FP06_STIAD|nr:trigger factor [Stigmatella aurantiaca]ADO70624.1 Trigger factor [Stigmatella aurantiaca DW4/3-1]